MNVSGGTIGDSFSLADEQGAGSIVNISGGTVSASFWAYGPHEVNFLVRQLELDGVPAHLTVNERLVIGDRDVRLSGQYVDGSSFDVGLAATWFGGGATVTVTVIPEPTTANLLGIAILVLMKRANRRR